MAKISNNNNFSNTNSINIYYQNLSGAKDWQQINFQLQNKAVFKKGIKMQQINSFIAKFGKI